jgi:hypothetical protein
MKYFTAKEARANTKKTSRGLDLAFQAIESAVNRGDHHCELDINNIFLNEEDYKKLEELGYKVQRAGYKYSGTVSMYMLGLVYW